MSTPDFWIGIVLGAVLSKYILLVWDLTMSGLYARHAALRERYLEPIRLRQTIVEYYRHRNVLSDLYYSPRIARHIPFLTAPLLIVPRELSSSSDQEPLSVSNVSRRPVQISPFASARRQGRLRAGKRLTNGSILVFDDILMSATCQAHEGRYFDALDTWLHLENETVRKVRYRQTPTRFRDKNYSAFQVALRSRPRKVVGVGVAILLWSPTRSRVLLSRTSAAVVSATTGHRSVIPFFTASNMPPARGTGLLQLNMLREIGEEIFNVPELEDTQGSAHMDPLWFRNIPVLNVLLRAIDESSQLFYLSSGFDAFNGTFEQHYCLMIPESDDVEAAILRAMGNWEIARSTTGDHLELVDLTDEALLDALNRDEFSIGSTVALLQLLDYWAGR